jgi:aryl-alcohol dehydrogenase-like predicted oxidoreductase
MDYMTLGRTGLEVSVAGLGAGGASRLGKAYGKRFDESVSVVREAIDLGINFIDTAVVYGTEEIVGAAIKGQRDKVVLSSKAWVIREGADVHDLDYCTTKEFVARVEGSLKRLGTDYIDIYHLHGVTADQVPHSVATFIPALHKLRDQGKIGYIGLTERFITDTNHEASLVALQHDCWDVIMLGFNLLNPSARKQLLKLTRERKIGTLDMFAVRRALSKPGALAETLGIAVEARQLDSSLATDGVLDFLLEPGGAASLQEAAYRFCRHEPGIDVVLTGTGSTEHLRENVESILQGPLPAKHLARLEELFGKVDTISGN